MDWIKQNQGKIITSAGLLAALGMAYQYQKKQAGKFIKQSPDCECECSCQSEKPESETHENDLKTTPAQPSQNRKKSSSESHEDLKEILEEFKFLKDPNYQEKLKHSADVIKKMPGYSEKLNIQVLAVILELTNEIYGEYYANLVKKQRKQRRGLKPHSKKYIQCIKHQVEQIEKEANLVQYNLVQRLGMDVHDFEQKVVALAQKGYAQQIQMLDMGYKMKLKAKVPSKQEKNLEKAKEIAQYQIDYVEQNVDEIKEILKEVVGTQDFVRGAQYCGLMVTDKIYEKFQVEEEDIQKMVNYEENTDDEINQLMDQYEMKLEKILVQILKGEQ